MHMRTIVTVLCSALCDNRFFLSPVSLVCVSNAAEKNYSTVKETDEHVFDAYSQGSKKQRYAGCFLSHTSPLVVAKSFVV